METVGVIGTGEIGSRIGRLLAAAGYRVLGYDRDPEALDRACRLGAERAAGIEALASAADVVITCLTDGTALRDVLLGDGGIVESLPDGATVIDTTSAEPWITAEIAPRLAARGIAFLDAPVSGGVPAAETGRMNFMVGGDPGVLDRWRPLLACLGPVVTHVGPVGSGHAIKAINMLALAGSMLATAEVLDAGCRCGLAPSSTVEAFEAGRGGSYSTRVHFPRFVLPGTFDSGFSFDLMYKDLSIATALAARYEFDPWMGARAYEIYRVAKRSGLAGEDNTRIVEMRPSPRPPRAPVAGWQRLLDELDGLAEAANAAIAAETLLLGVRAGLAPATVVDVVTASSGTSTVLETDMRHNVLAGTFDSGATIGELRIRAARALARAVVDGVPMILGASAVALLTLAEAAFGAEADRTRFVQLLAQRTGTRLLQQ